MPAPRIDTLRNQLTGTIALLQQALAVLEALHDVAYDRAAAGEQLRTSGGQPDYALDRHGDPRARAAYAGLGAAVLHACDHLSRNARTAISRLNDGEPASSTGRRRAAGISPLEHAEALDAQARRLARGEFDPGRTTTQPTAPRAQRQITGKIKSLELQLTAERKARQRAERRADRLEARLAAARPTSAARS